MDTLILIGVILLTLVLLVDCMIRLVIVWFQRKRKRSVKPLGFDEPVRDRQLADDDNENTDDDEDEHDRNDEENQAP